MTRPVKRTTNDASCDGCSDDRELADFQGRALCYTCWHAAREATPPYHVRRRSNPSQCSHAAFVPVVYTLEEATARAAELNAAVVKSNAFWTEYDAEKEREGSDWRSNAGNQLADWEPVPASNWCGERVAHPGYMTRHRAALRAAGRVK